MAVMRAPGLLSGRLKKLIRTDLRDLGPLCISKGDCAARTQLARAAPVGALSRRCRHYMSDAHARAHQLPQAPFLRPLPEEVVKPVRRL